LLRFANSKWLHHSNRDDFETIAIYIDSIQTELSNKDLQTSSEDLQNTVSDMDIEQLEDHLEKIKQLYTDETGQTVIDKQYS
jgi:hypothetical protein